MAHKGQVLVNRSTGETVEFLETGRDNNGQRLRFKYCMKPGGLKPVQHFHALQDETFEVISGKLAYVLDGVEKLASPGETVLLPKGVRHTHFNGHDAETVVIQSHIPALDSEAIVETLYYLDSQGKMNNGEPPLLQVMVWLKELSAKTYLASIPRGVQDALSFVLGPVGKMAGYKTTYTS